jgi:hypothetical protein
LRVKQGPRALRVVERELTQSRIDKHQNLRALAELPVAATMSLVRGVNVGGVNAHCSK